MAETAAPEIDFAALRYEYDELNQTLRAHGRKEIVLEAERYSKTLRRSLEILGLLNNTTAGPKKTQSKAKKEVQAATPLSLEDL